MKKIFALILVLLMLVPFVASCKKNNDDSSSSSNTNTSTNTGSTNTGSGNGNTNSGNTNTGSGNGNTSGGNTNTDSGNGNTGSGNTNTNTNTDGGSTGGGTTGGNDVTSPDIQANIDAIKGSFAGQTINILASGVFSGSAGTSGAGAPWGQAELCVKARGDKYNENAGGFGKEINNAVLDRQAEVQSTYGVTLNWIECGGYSMQTRLRTAAQNKELGGEVIHVALPRVLEAQAIVLDQSVYNINGSEYIDFDAKYYNQDALDSYTLADKTFFLAGDISFLDEQTAFVVFFNNEIANELESFPDLYEMALNGTWTIDTLYSLASAISENTDGQDGYSDNDKYGFGTNGLSVFYQYFGVYQVSKKATADGEEYYLSIQDDKVSTIINKMLYTQQHEDFIRTGWTGGYGALQAAFTDNRLLFYHEVIQKLDYLAEDPDLQAGILPFPKLNTDQKRYYSPSASQSTLICVPRATDDRDMSEAFVEILSCTASKHIMPAYMNMIESKLYYDFAEQSIRVLNEQIFPNMMYDQGYMYEFGGLATNIQSGSIEGGVNNFTSAYANGRGSAETKIAEWNLTYYIYED